MTSAEAHHGGGEESSKFKRFMKRFSRQPSSDGLGTGGLPSSASSTALALPGGANGKAERRASSWVQSAEHTDYSKQDDYAAPLAANKYATLNGRKSTKGAAADKGKNRRSFFGSNSASAGAPQPASHRTSSAPVLPPIGAGGGGGKPLAPSAAAPAPGSAAALTLGFDEPVRATNLAGTLKIPRSASQQLADAHGGRGGRSPPPQLAGLPTHEELIPSDFLPAPSPRLPEWTPSATTTTTHTSNAAAANGAALGLAQSSRETATATTSERPETGRSEGTTLAQGTFTPIAAATAAGATGASSTAGGRGTTSSEANGDPASSSTAVNAAAPTQRSGGSPSALPAQGSSSSSGSPSRVRDSSRSISPSTRRNGSSSSLDDASLGAHTADTGKGSRFSASTKPTTLMSLETREAGAATGAAASPMAGIATHRHGDVPPTSAAAASASASAPTAISFAAANNASNGTNGAQSHEAYITIPALSRPHPANNPSPSGIPPDNASVLTLASSTARESFYAPSARPAPSLGGARSIGGSILGDHLDRRNSSDTYASVKALPPLSRRGSDASSRTKDSGAVSIAGREGRERDVAAPGAPGDRISMHRTASQRTVATQLSIPLSASAAATAASANASGVPNPSPLAADTSAEFDSGASAGVSRATSDSQHPASSPAEEGDAAPHGVLAPIPAITETGPSPSESVDAPAPSGKASPLPRTSTSSTSANVPPSTYATPPRASRRSSVQMQADAMAAAANAGNGDTSTGSIASSAGSQRKRHVKSGSAVEALARRFEQK